MNFFLAMTDNITSQKYTYSCEDLKFHKLKCTGEINKWPHGASGDELNKPVHIFLKAVSRDSSCQF
jgi:hypothetical protein